jgi:hypothetical protein
VDDFLDEATDVAVTFGEIERTQLGRTLSVGRAGLEDGGGTLSLGSNDATHLNKSFNTADN